MSPPDPDPLVGTILGGCRVERLLGRGGMGSVYLGTQTRLLRPVAMKVLDSELARDDEYLNRFDHEAVTIAQLNHPNIVQVHYMGREQDRSYIVMEFVEGCTLENLLEPGPMPVNRACSIILQVAQALEAAWTRRIVHRDIKPSNILVMPDGTTKVADFGLARSVARAEAPTNEVIGSPHYMSPELCRGEPADIRADLYALGITLWHCLTGRPPFLGDTEMTIMLQHVQDPVPDPRLFSSDVPHEIASLVLRMTAKKPDDRAPSPTVVVSALRSFLASQRSGIGPQDAGRTHDLLTAIVESSEDAIFGVSRDGLVQSWNGGGRTVYGYTADQIVGRPAAILLPSDRKEVLAELLARIANGERVHELEAVHVRRDGGRIVVSLSFSPLHDGSGAIIGASWIARDITERKRREEQLLAGERKFRALTESVADAIVTADSGGDIVYVNPATERIFGWSRDKAVGRPLTLFMPERFHEPHRLGLKRYLETGEARLIGRTVEVTGRRKDGSEFPAELAISTWKSPDGIFFTAILRDISERRRSEHRMVWLQRALEEAAEGTARFDAEGRHLRADHAYALLVGYEPGDLPSLSWEAVIHPDDRDRVRSAFERARKEGRGETQARVLRRDGTLLPRKIELVKAFDAANRHIGFHGFMKSSLDTLRP